MGIQLSKHTDFEKKNSKKSRKKKQQKQINFHMSTRTTRNIKNNLRSNSKIPKCLK